MEHRQIFVDSLKTFGYAGQNSQESYKLWLVDVLRQYDEFNLASNGDSWSRST